jgi:hypothetical protein
LWFVDSVFQRIDSKPRPNNEIKRLGNPSRQKVRPQASLKRSFVLKAKGPERQQQDGRPEKKRQTALKRNPDLLAKSLPYLFPPVQILMNSLVVTIQLEKARPHPSPTAIELSGVGLGWSLVRSGPGEEFVGCWRLYLRTVVVVFIKLPMKGSDGPVDQLLKVTIGYRTVTVGDYRLPLGY